MKTRDVAMAGLATAVVFVITRTLVVPIPQTRGFFNLGEAGIYAASVLFGPLVGGLAGGVASVLEGLPELATMVEEPVRTHALEAATARLRIVRAALGNQAGVVGAAAMARHRIGEIRPH